MNCISGRKNRNRIPMDSKTLAQRHENMAAIHGKNTKPEILVRRYLFSHGLRFRIHDKRFPGHPDIVLPKHKTVVFVNGCFWHGHEGCKYASIPSTNTEFWKAKIKANVSRDAIDKASIENAGWKVLTVWTCELRNNTEKASCLSRLYRSITDSP